MTTDKLITTLYTIILVLSIVFAMYSSYNFAMGSHNIDTGQNLRFLNAKYGLDLIDLTSNEEWRTGSELYIYGQNQIRESFIILGISVFLIGLSLSKIYQGEKE